MSVQHCVFFTFKKDVSETERTMVYNDLEAISGLIDGMDSFVYGPNTSFEGMERGYHDGFIITFRDRDAHMAYHEHAAHKAAGAKLVDAVTGGIDGIFVFDFES